MKIRFLAVAALASLVTVAACGKKDGGDEQTTSDTMAVPGTDTVSQPTVVPTTDSVVTTTTTTTDTMQGQVNEDSVKADTVK